MDPRGSPTVVVTVASGDHFAPLFPTFPTARGIRGRKTIRDERDQVLADYQFLKYLKRELFVKPLHTSKALLR